MPLFLLVLLLLSMWAIERGVRTTRFIQTRRSFQKSRRHVSGGGGGGGSGGKRRSNPLKTRGIISVVLRMMTPSHRVEGKGMEGTEMRIADICHHL